MLTGIRQAYLKFMGIQFSIVSSNNHASPTGALPFLIPSSPMSTATKIDAPIASTKLQLWAQAEVSQEGFKPHLLSSREPTCKSFQIIAKSAGESDHTREAAETNVPRKEPPGVRYEAYMSLLDCRIRSAWVKNSCFLNFAYFN